MTTEMEVKPSPELEKLVNKINQQFDSAKDLVMTAYNLALEEGFRPHEARKYLYENITVLNDRTIRRYLPDEAKDLSKTNISVRNSNADRDPHSKQGTTQAQSAEVLTQNPIEVKVTEGANYQDLYFKSITEKNKALDDARVLKTQHESDAAVNRELMKLNEDKDKKIKSLQAQINVKSTGFVEDEDDEKQYLRDQVKSLQNQVQQLTASSPAAAKEELTILFDEPRIALHKLLQPIYSLRNKGITTVGIKIWKVD